MNSITRSRSFLPRVESLEQRQMLAADADTVLDLWPGPGHGDTVLVDRFGNDAVLLAHQLGGQALFLTDGTPDGTRRIGDVHANIEVFIRGDELWAIQDSSLYQLQNDLLVFLTERPGIHVQQAIPASGTTATIYWLDIVTDGKAKAYTYDDIDGRQFSGIGYCRLACSPFETPVRIEGNYGADVIASVENPEDGTYTSYFATGSQDTWSAFPAEGSSLYTIADSFVFLRDKYINSSTHDITFYSNSGELLVTGINSNGYSQTRDYSSYFVLSGTVVGRVLPDSFTPFVDVATARDWEFPLTYIGATGHGDYALVTVQDDVYFTRYFLATVDGSFQPLANRLEQLPDGYLLSWTDRIPLGVFAGRPIYNETFWDSIINDRHFLVPADYVFETGREIAVRTLMPGDANLDGYFNSDDLLILFQLGEYEDDVVGNSTWATGDWNGDQEFDSSDLIEALALGWYRS